MIVVLYRWLLIAVILGMVVYGVFEEGAGTRWRAPSVLIRRAHVIDDYRGDDPVLLLYPALTAS